MKELHEKTINELDCVQVGSIKNDIHHGKEGHSCVDYAVRFKTIHEWIVAIIKDNRTKSTSNCLVAAKEIILTDMFKVTKEDLK